MALSIKFFLLLSHLFYSIVLIAGSLDMSDLSSMMDEDSNQANDYSSMTSSDYGYDSFNRQTTRETNKLRKLRSKLDLEDDESLDNMKFEQVETLGDNEAQFIQENTNQRMNALEQSFSNTEQTFTSDYTNTSNRNRGNTNRQNNSVANDLIDAEVKASIKDALKSIKDPIKLMALETGIIGSDDDQNDERMLEQRVNSLDNGFENMADSLSTESSGNSQLIQFNNQPKVREWERETMPKSSIVSSASEFDEDLTQKFYDKAKVAAIILVILYLVYKLFSAIMRRS